jgi:ATP-dependent RNA helicase DDX10/DBP4
VLDEADRLLDLGFAPALKAIVGHFSTTSTPGSRPDRQTLLFSATQSKDLAALVKLSLHDPLYINCNKPGEEGVVPANLEQYYAVVNLDKKLDALWGFVKSHLKMKGVVFVTSGKQVSHTTQDENVKLIERSDSYTKPSVDFTLVFPSYIFTGNKNKRPG